MFKTPPDKIAVIDIETVPCIDTIRRAYALDPTATDEQVLAYAYLEHKATPENPTPFLKPMFHRVVSVSVLYRTSQMVNGGRKVELKFYTLPKVNGTVEQLSEADIVRRTLGFIGRNKAQVVGWNSFGFDQTALFNRAVILGVTIPAYCERPNKPWEGNDYFAKFSDANVDLMLCLAGEGGGAKPKLGEFASACGIPGKISEVHGGGVAEAYRAGRLAEIVAYNEFDTASTYLLWLRMAWIGGHLTDAAYLEEQEIFKVLLRSRIDEGAKHFSEYLAAWTGEEYKAKAEPGAGLDTWRCTQESGGSRQLALAVIQATERYEASLDPAKFPAPESRQQVWKKELRATFAEYEWPFSRKALSAAECQQWLNLLTKMAETNEAKAKTATA